MNFNNIIDTIVNDNYIRDLDSGTNPDDIGYIDDIQLEQDYYNSIQNKCSEVGELW